jgi:signal transduction histidine kinase
MVPLHVDVDVEGREELAAVIDRRRHDVIDRWLRRVQASLTREVTPTDLKNAIDDYLGALADGLRRGGRVSVEAEQAWTDFSSEHALTRVRLGFDVRQLIREFIELRRALFEVIQEEGVLRQPDQAMRLADLIEVAIALTVDKYVQSRDYASKKQEAEHIGFLTHELRSPLSSAELVAELIARDPGKNPKLVGRLRGSLQVIQDLIDKVFLKEKLDRVELANRPLELALAELFEAPLQPIREEAVRKGLTLEVSVPPDVRAYADPTLTVSALRNLVGNAIKYTDGGVVRVEVEVRQNDIAIHVRDSCPGLSQEELRTIFEPFKRGHTAKPGTGLGLAIARRAVEIQGGQLHAESSGEGGCHFWFTLPRLPH